jgi:hypothetical protein
VEESPTEAVTMAVTPTPDEPELLLTPILLDRLDSEPADNYIERVIAAFRDKGYFREEE